MSLKKSPRRLRLLAGSSLVAAGLSAFAFTGAALTPTLALAYDECAPADAPITLTDGAGGVSDPSLNGTAADTFVCTAATYATGITYSSAGNLTVSKTNTGTTTVTANGVKLAGAGANAVTWNSSAGTVAGGAGTAGPVIDVTSVSGPISITTAGVTGTAAGTTHGIRATSTGAGAITITRSTGTVSNSVVGGVAAIEAVTNGGNISITTAGTTSGRQRGILAQTSGTGTITISASSATNAVADDGNPATADGVAAIETIAGTGTTTITNNSGLVDGGAGPAIRAVSASTSATAVNVQVLGGSVRGPVDFSGVTVGGVMFNNPGAGATAGRWIARGASVFGGGADTVILAGIGDHSMAAGTTVNFGAGADTFNLSGHLAVTSTALDFGTGADTMNLSGALAVDGLSITNAEAINLSGAIFLGTGEVLSGCCTLVPGFEDSDIEADDTLVIRGSTLIGSNGGRVEMDVVLGTETQTGCATLTGAGDCLDLRDSSTAGVTLLTLNSVGDPSRLGSYNPVGVVLVDVSGSGTSAAGHFVLDPNSAGYVEDPFLGASINRPGLFRYTLQYDVANQRHVMVGLPRREAIEYAILSGAAQSVWHLTAETVTDRQGDLREGAQGGSVWMRAGGEYTRRDMETTFTSVGQTFAVDNSYKLYAGAVIAGLDLISGRSGDYSYVLGLQAGYVSSSFDLSASDSSGRFSGATGGVYSGLWSDWFFLDGTINANGLTLDYAAPGLRSKTTTFLNSIGGRAEAGVRTKLSDSTFAEPLLTLAFVRTTFEEVSLFGGEIEPEDAKSLRGGLGLRVGGTLAGEGASATYFVTGRTWEEFEGESTGVVKNPGVDLPLTDDFSGAFGEAEVGVNVYNSANTLSGFLTGGVKFKDSYSAVNLSLGVRMAW